MAPISNGNTWGTQLKNLRVEVVVRPAPFNDVDSVRLFELNSNREIPLSQLNEFEQANIIENARAEIKSGYFGSSCQPVSFGGFI